MSDECKITNFDGCKFFYGYQKSEDNFMFNTKYFGRCNSDLIDAFASTVFDGVDEEVLAKMEVREVVIKAYEFSFNGEVVGYAIEDLQKDA